MPTLAPMKTEREPIVIDFERLFRMRRATDSTWMMSPSDCKQHRKLVAAQARDDVARIDRRAQAPGDLREHEVAGGVTRAIR